MQTVASPFKESSLNNMCVADSGAEVNCLFGDGRDVMDMNIGVDLMRSDITEQWVLVKYYYWQTSNQNRYGAIHRVILYSVVLLCFG